MVKNPPVNAGTEGDTGLIPRSGRSPEGGNATHSSILAWEIPWTKESCGLQSMGLDITKRTEMQADIISLPIKKKIGSGIYSCAPLKQYFFS